MPSTIERSTCQKISTSKNGQKGSLNNMILPVVLHHKENPGIEVLTYALLDNQYDACFISEALLDRMQAHTQTVNLELTTMLSRKVIKSQIVYGLMVRGLSEQVDFPLPKKYCRTAIPVNRDYLILRPETVRQWPHLQRVSEHLHPYRDDIDIGLLIGFNCSAAMLPREVAVASDNDPYGVRTCLGWGVTGQMQPVSSTYEEEHKNTRFAFKTSVKEVNPEEIKSMYALEFSERHPDEKLSLDDRRFLQKVKNDIHLRQDGHFEMGLKI